MEGKKRVRKEGKERKGNERKGKDRKGGFQYSDVRGEHRQKN